ncbi:hypothetical protein LX15_002604 [Streptoalloteichus tenebrarius]|uniref:Uncharacterized protein n=1 Tax=Streptoalloteichus tenebrarius (strain ATCC 17920 / DSM 40477 / JCM 4838 / CBS 697.72 / NBRC 16177 / NCIMB 11028 / NRRL B-12390 / A12253. 1 / ISP 5477) TaxID=1933 RepID=A0ABT1HU20_STRSD|nr:hypothetical protein [Streptoalloteichus tenebrarius]MCP2258905.1 hypothetical protein [Streptoalloteichus tenebrarius]BFF01113.1 hypothetical protein GCM10020241_27880 [Streptoalloteichus tenebrarius]
MELVRDGWRLEKQGHGWYLYCPCPERGVIMVASTPKNPEGHARAIERQAARRPDRHALDARPRPRKG